MAITKIGTDIIAAGAITADKIAAGALDTQLAGYLSTNSFATESYVGTALTNLVDSSPATLDTLNELAAALGDDPNFATTTATAIGLKAPLASPSFTGNVGVGTSSPAAKLHTASGVARTSTAKTETAFFSSTDGDDFRFGLAISHKGGTTDADRYASLDSTAYRISTDAFATGGSLVLQELGGNVGIGLASPIDSKLVIQEVPATIVGGNAISGSTMKGIKLQTTLNSVESVGLWFGTNSGTHWSGISGQRTTNSAGTGVDGWATDLRFYTHEYASADLTYARERMRIDGAGAVTAPYQPRFIAYGASSGYIPSTYSQSVIFPTVANTSGHYSTSTGLFTAPVTGTYLFQASIYSTTTANWSQAWLTINGARGSYTDVISGDATLISTTHLVDLTAGDTVGYHPYTGSGTYSIYANLHHTYFKGRLLG